MGRSTRLAPVATLIMPAYACPVCGFLELHDPPRSAAGGASYEICPSCGFQFGVSDDDRGETYAEWRRRWLADGMPWRGAQSPPKGWNPDDQIGAVDDA